MYRCLNFTPEEIKKLRNDANIECFVEEPRNKTFDLLSLPYTDKV